MIQNRKATRSIALLALAICLLLGGCKGNANSPAPSIEPTAIPTPTPEPEPQQLYAFLPPSEGEYRGKKLVNYLVDVRHIVPGIWVDLMYFRKNNYFEQQMYPADICLLQMNTAQKLKKAQQLANEQGYQLVVYDAYRPLGVQQKMYEIMPDSSYVADPNKGVSHHNRGAAVDVSLADLQGNLLEMPSEVDCLNVSARRDMPNLSEYTQGSAEYNAAVKRYPELLELPARTETATKNMAILTDIMTQAGFAPLNSEWWHYDDTDARLYLPTDIDLATVPLQTPPRKDSLR
ncbi:M15 family metallopeptidase [Eubacteriales bacterium OttesenSCG-928-N14]|nr:M15 family metallopeptidase [Eubacteriales bacterium OttesenSCG-928-N14]